MALRAAMNGNKVIMEIGNDEGQSGQTPTGFTWCDWTFDAIPSWAMPDGLDTQTPMMFKENADQNGIEVRPDSEVLAAPQG